MRRIRYSSGLKAFGVLALMSFLLHPGRFSCWYDSGTVEESAKEQSSQSVLRSVLGLDQPPPDRLPDDRRLFSSLPDSIPVASNPGDLAELAQAVCNLSQQNERSETVVLIPYRDRRDHLAVLLDHFATFFKDTVRPNILVLEQFGNLPFNRGKLFNVGYVESVRVWDPSCLILHDVDLLPGDSVPYSCSSKPRHMSSSIDKFRYVLPYPEMTGGVLAISPEQFSLINGFSNLFYGWGGEDDDLYRRMETNGLELTRFSGERSRFRSLYHPPQQPSPHRHKILEDRGRGTESGISSLTYRILELHSYTCFTHIIVDID